MTVRYVVGSTVQLDIERGDSALFSVTWQDSNNDPVDLTGYTVVLLDSDDENIDSTIAVPTPGNGQINISFSAPQTTVMVDQYYRLRAGTSSFNQTTLLEGRINIT